MKPRSERSAVSKLPAINFWAKAAMENFEKAVIARAFKGSQENPELRDAIEADYEKARDRLLKHLPRGSAHRVKVNKS